VVTRTRTLRAASFNLLSGRSLDDGRSSPERLTAAVRSLDADLLAVQEVDRGQPRSGNVDQAALLAEAVGAVDSRYVETVVGTPGEPGWRRASDGELPDEPGYGVALISRLPVAEWHQLRLKPARGRYPLTIPTRPPTVRWLQDEPRAAIAAVLEDPQLTVVCTHLSFVPPTTALQLRAVRRWMGRLPEPYLLLGDLNLPIGAARRLTGWIPLVVEPTYPSPAPKLQLDHALVTGLPHGAHARGWAEQLPISDHRAVVVDLDLPT
jgi:endonuclease/exonuclease/phosphatase family metal-dependent hydrolase